MINKAISVDWKTIDVAESLDELNKTDLAQTFWRLIAPFAQEERRLILSEVPAAAAIYREWASYGNRQPQKLLMTKVCSLPFMSRSLYQRFVALLDPEVKTILEYLALKGPLNHQMIERELDIVTYQMEEKEVGVYSYRRETINILPRFRLLPARVPSPYYYSSENVIVFHLPKVLQKVIAILSHPAEIIIPAHPELPAGDTSLQVFYGEELILRELPGVIIYLNSKQPKLSKKGRPNAASIRAMGKKLALTEFYSTTRQKTLLHFRANMLASLLLQKNKLPDQLEVPKLIRTLFQETYEKKFRSALHLMTHVRGISSLRSNAFRAVEFASKEYFRPLFQEGWVAYPEWQHYQETAGYAIDFIQPDETRRLVLEVPQTYSRNSFSYELSIAPHYVRKFIQWPILHAQVFLFAAWGLLDIAYDEPNCQVIGQTCDSPYDGVRYLRLTALGAYALGYTDHYEASIARPFELELSNDVLSILLSAGDMELATRAIASFARPVGSKRFQTNADMFLQDCNSAQDLKQKIDLFSTLFPGDLPPNWQSFFRELSQKANPLTTEEFQVFSIDPNDQNLLQLLAQDEKIRELCSKAEGYRILVRPKDFKRLQKLLRAYGYLVE